MQLQKYQTPEQNYPLAQTGELITQELGTETLIYILKNSKAFCLNDTTRQVWNACDGTRSVSEISRLLSDKNHTPVTEDIVWLALEQLKKNELLAGEFAIDFHGLSRREMIKRAGLATMIALPVISSLVAPLAVSAASGNTSGACTSNCTILGGVGSVCNCSTGSVVCSPGRLVNATVGVGVCVTASVAASTLGVSVGAGANGNVCLIAAACLL